MRTWILKGSEQKAAKLTEAAVAQSRTEHVPWSREFGAAALARRRDVSLGLMKKVLAGERWKHAPGLKQPVFFDASGGP
jgi:hypothetical protein